MTEAPFLYDCQPQTDFDSQFARIFEAAGCRTQLELAEFLNIKQSSVSDAKRRKTVPSEWLVKLFEKKRINHAWLRNGTGGKFIHAASEEEGKRPAVMTAIMYRPAKECTTEELLAELARRTLNKLGE